MWGRYALVIASSFELPNTKYLNEGLYFIYQLRSDRRSLIVGA